MPKNRTAEEPVKAGRQRVRMQRTAVAVGLWAAATLAACANSGVVVGGPAMQVGFPIRRATPMGDTVADRLYFGRNVRAGCATAPGGTVTDSAWTAFVREVVTGRFPDGLTVYGGEGQWREPDGRIVREE